MTAGSIIDVVLKRFNQHGIKFNINTNIIPEDNTTLFVCSGMQIFRDKFRNPDQSKISSLQSCIRTDDLNLVGDGSHLTYFEMLGNFSFGRNDYKDSVELWDSIIKDLNLPVTSIHVYPTKSDHKIIWEKIGYETVPDLECVWSDGEIGGYCCEMYCGDLEIGNLVNTQEISTDVGFGFERILQVKENKQRVDQTSLFIQNINPIVSDHIRSIQSLIDNNINPGGKQREWVLRNLIRRIIKITDYTGKNEFNLPIDKLLKSEYEIYQNRINRAKSTYQKYSNKNNKWWWTSFGISEEEIEEIREQMK